MARYGLYDRALQNRGAALVSLRSRHTLTAESRFLSYAALAADSGMTLCVFNASM